MLLTILDRTSRWPEAVPLAAVSAPDCAAGFFHGWVHRFRLPATITSDRGPQFASSLWSALCSLLNINHLQTTAYHPQANGAVERFHRRLKDALRACAAGADRYAHLPTRQDTVSTLRLKPCRSLPDVQPAVPPRRGQPPTSPAAASPPADVPRPPAIRRRRVTFRCPVVVPLPESSPPPGPPLPLLHPSGRPARRAGRPQRYLSSLDVSAGGDVWTPTATTTTFYIVFSNQLFPLSYV